MNMQVDLGQVIVGSLTIVQIVVLGIIGFFLKRMVLEMDRKTARDDRLFKELSDSINDLKVYLARVESRLRAVERHDQRRETQNQERRDGT